ncbi:MAG: hypothetical protein IJ775_06785 [Muribaculaceae bacterium]|nr:hypothetical protein [Muribaculaceae bacterium]
MIKQLLTVLLLTLTMTTTCWANEIVFEAGTDVGATSITKDGVTITMSHMDNANYYVVLALTEMTVAAEEGLITSIEFECTEYSYGSSYFSQYAPEGYTYDQDGKKGYWSGSADVVTFKPTSHVRMPKITVNAEALNTAVSDVNAQRQVASTTYCDLSGRMSSTPFDGINIVVTRYTDGTTSTSKVMK